MSNQTESSNPQKNNPDSSADEDTRGPINYTIDDGGVDTTALAEDIVRLTWDVKALNTQAIDLRGRVSYTDFVIVCTATADRHLQAVARHVINSLAAAGFKTIGSEGVESGEWALVDFGDIILHVFSAERREEYALESMWRDAPKLEVEGRPDELYGHFDTQRF